MSIRQDLYYYKANKRKIAELQEKIEYLRAKAEKITPTYSDDKTGGAFGTGSKVEENMIRILELEEDLKKIEERIDATKSFLDTLKPYRYHIVWSCLVEHMPYHLVARKENTSTQNIAKIVNKALKKETPAI